VIVVTDLQFVLGLIEAVDWGLGDWGVATGVRQKTGCRWPPFCMLLARRRRLTRCPGLYNPGYRAKKWRPLFSVSMLVALHARLQDFHWNLDCSAKKDTRSAPVQDLFVLCPIHMDGSELRTLLDPLV
jgi:hypothetical protein